MGVSKRTPSLCGASLLMVHRGEMIGASRKDQLMNHLSHPRLASLSVTLAIFAIPTVLAALAALHLPEARLVSLLGFSFI